MNRKIELSPVQGYNKVFDVGEYGMKLTKFGLIKLANGTSYAGETGEMEVALVLMGGNFAAKGDGWSFDASTCRAIRRTRSPRSPTWSSRTTPRPPRATRRSPR